MMAIYTVLNLLYGVDSLKICKHFLTHLLKQDSRDNNKKASRRRLPPTKGKCRTKTTREPKPTFHPNLRGRQQKTNGTCKTKTTREPKPTFHPNQSTESTSKRGCNRASTRNTPHNWSAAPPCCRVSRRSPRKCPSPAQRSSCNGTFRRSWSAPTRRSTTSWTSSAGTCRSSSAPREDRSGMPGLRLRSTTAFAFRRPPTCCLWGCFD